MLAVALGTWFRDEHSGAALMAGLSQLSGFYKETSHPCADPAGSRTSHLSSSGPKFLMRSLNLRFSFHKTAPARASALQHYLGKPKKGGQALKKNHMVL